MDKSKISLIIGMACTMIGAFIINQGFGFIVTGIWAFIASFVESLKQDDEEEHKAPTPKKEIWHDSMLKAPPEHNGDIVLINTRKSNWIVGPYYSESEKFYSLISPNGIPWCDIVEVYNYRKWCYLDDLLEK